MFDVVDLTEECRRAAGEDLSMLGDDELLATVVGLEAARSAMEVAEARALAEVHARKVTDRCFGHRTASWVAAQVKVDRRKVAARLAAGMRLRRVGEVTDAVATGLLSADHAEVLAEAVANPRVGDQVELTVGVWIELAGSTSFADWAHQLRSMVVLLDDDGGYDPDREVGRNRLKLTPLPDGSVTLVGELVGEQALVVRQCVEAHADRLFHRLSGQAKACPELAVPTRATLLALALAELVLRGSTVDLEHSDGPATDVTLIIEATKTHNTDTDATERSPLVQRCGPALTPDGFPVPHPVAEVLLCDPIITALIVDSLGVPLDLGREVRLADRRQRRALGRRDGGCVFPGCDAPTGWCDAHHVTWWHDGGPTDIDNLALLCRYHHGVVHRRGWTMTATTDQWFTVTTRSGQTLHSQRHRGRRPNPLILQAA